MNTTSRRTARLFLIVAFVAGCGPSAATIKSYVITSRRRTVALMPLSVADGQRDVTGVCERALRDRLSEYGFLVVERPALDPSLPVFGPHTAAPRIDDVESYGRKSNAAVVLVGRVERALDSRPGRDAVYRDQRRWITDANGRRVQVVEQVIAHPAQNSVAAAFRLDLRLIDAATGATLWRETASNDVPEWTLAEAATYACQSKASDLAEAYLNRKL